MSLQAVSYLSEEELLPYWLNRTLSKAYQQTWWTQSLDFLLNKAKSKSTSDQQTSINRFLELIRLKSNTIKLSDHELDGSVKSDGKQNNRQSVKYEQYKQNLIIVIKLTLYLQYMLNAFSSKFKLNKLKTETDGNSSIYLNANYESDMDDLSDDYLLIDPLIGNEYESEFSPKQKIDQLTSYLMQHWSYLTRELIKLKQIRGACNDIEDLHDLSFVDTTGSLINLNQYEYDNDNMNSIQHKHKNYFNYSFRLLNNRRTSFVNENLLIQAGLLELILNYMEKLGDDLDTNEIDAILDNALSKFELIEANLNETDFNSYQLNVSATHKII